MLTICVIVRQVLHMQRDWHLKVLLLEAVISTIFHTPKIEKSSHQMWVQEVGPSKAIRWWGRKFKNINYIKYLTFKLFINPCKIVLLSIYSKKLSYHVNYLLIEDFLLYNRFYTLLENPLINRITSLSTYIRMFFLQVHSHFEMYITRTTNLHLCYRISRQCDEFRVPT